MSDHAEIIDALSEYANTRVITPAELSADPADVFGPPIGTMLHYAQTLGSRAELNALLAEVAPLIRADEPFRGSVIAISCGTLVEMGGDPAIVAPHLFATLPRHFDLARKLRAQIEQTNNEDEDAIFADDPDGLQATKGLTYLLLPTMAVLCRAMEFRQQARAIPEIVAGVQALRDVNREADFVAQVLDYTDGLELLVLAPQEHKGFRIALEAVNDNFHLFTLLQGVLIGEGHLDGEPPDPEVVGLATGEIPHQGVRMDHARWHFYNWAGVGVDGSFAATDFRTWIPGDAQPPEIPDFEGERIVVIGPKVLGARSWDSNCFANIHDAVRSGVRITEVLTPEQVLMQLNRIQERQR
jgi:hypothetical protein